MLQLKKVVIMTVLLNVQAAALCRLRQLRQLRRVRRMRELRRASHTRQTSQSQQEAGRKRRRYSVHPLWRSRDTEGELILFKQMLTDNEEMFYEHFRISRDCFATLLRKTEDQLVKKCTPWKTPIAPEERLAVCLRYLATGDSFKNISYNFRMGRATVHQIVKETCTVITRTLMPETIPTPSVEMWEKIKLQFWEKCQFPNCLGAIDGKYVNIQGSSSSGSKNSSTVLMAVADANSNFIAVEVGPFGQNSESGSFSQSQLGQAINNGSYRTLPDTNLPGTSICTPCVIVGGQAFPLKRNLMRPYPESKAEGKEDITYFNTRLSIARRAVDNAFEMLAQRFGIYGKRIQTKPENVDCIIMATCVLHNFIRSYEGSCQTGRTHDLPQEDDAQSSATWNTLSPHGGNATRESFAIREKFKDYIFASRGSHTDATS